MTQDQIKETLRLHGMWLLGEVGGARANLREANLHVADLRVAAMAGCSGVIRASCSWTDHGAAGRELLAVHHPAKDDQPAVTLYYCGCFLGDIEQLRQYIADGDEKYRASRTLAADFCEARINEMLAARAGGEVP